MVIRFLGLPLEQIDELCKHKEVEITISCLQKESFKHTDGTTSIDKVLTSKVTTRIRNSQDLIQFDWEDIKRLDPKTKASLK